MQALRADDVLQRRVHGHVERHDDVERRTVDVLADRREVRVARSGRARRRAHRTPYHRFPHLERRDAPSGGAVLQMQAVHGPHVPLPPFGRRASDVRPLRRYELAARRTLDLVVASTVLVFAAPMMLIVAVLLKCTSRGPILFCHQRVGLGGREFRMIKFRTMKVGTAEDLQKTEKDQLDYIRNDFKLSATDPRISRIGRVLRRTSFDELPQMVNVLKGDMSIVGVRPIVREQLSLRPEIDQTLYCRLRPGITGLWQISGRSTVVQNQRIAIDRAYTAEWRPLWDAKILLKTPRSVLKAHNTT